ncbi:DUF222 domain-containing protein [Cryobacterium sp. PH31-L1]|uniref:DUF222 domain-containing protein n=1 Tax=Cryobacterium sp. PH31-L1 TaxID=3046199 RepID=UPI0024BB6B11|nr:DUF222 domain-containing protein [Cryobacterium sp. PH31-L1]MDJ0377896.1 DUF222 domain-containing protein [Cryobacterium sp. PH31-L1]
MNNLAMELTRAAEAVAALGCSSASFNTLTDAQVLAARGPIADLLRLSNTVAAFLAGTIAQRSRHELGQSGLAVRHGFGTPTLMVQDATGLSRMEAGRLLAVGVLMNGTDTAERRAADAAREAERVAKATADALAEAERAAERDAVREAERAAAWATLHPDLPPLPMAAPRPVPPPVPQGPVVTVEPVVVPWQAPILHAVTAGTLSPGVGDALLRGLGTLDQAITAETLAAALRLLLVEMPGKNTEQAYKRARRLRDDLDAAGIQAREKQARDDTTWSLWRRADGMVTLHALLAPEQGETWMATYDALTSPGRGGVRFVDRERAEWAQRVKDDPRTLDQIAADSFTQLLKLGTDADPNTMFGGRRPVVQIIVTEPDRPTTIPDPTTGPTAGPAAGPAPEAGPARTTGPAPEAGTTESGTTTSGTSGSRTATSAFGYLEGNPAPVSAETIERHLCDTGHLGILFSQSGQPLNVGRDERLFNREQRRALAARDGGCRWPDCDQPPSWTEAHHIKNGLIRDFPTSISPSPCVHTITCCYTTDTGRSTSRATNIGYNPRSKSTPNKR